MTTYLTADGVTVTPGDTVYVIGRFIDSLGEKRIGFGRQFGDNVHFVGGTWTERGCVLSSKAKAIEALHDRAKLGIADADKDLNRAKRAVVSAAKRLKKLQQKFPLAAAVLPSFFTPTAEPLRAIPEPSASPTLTLRRAMGEVGE